jgi:hypothetical protein
VLSRLTKTFERKSTVKVIINDKLTLKDEKKIPQRTYPLNKKKKQKSIKIKWKKTNINIKLDL